MPNLVNNPQYARVEKKGGALPFILVILVFAAIVYAGFALLKNKEVDEDKDTTSDKVVDLTDGKETGTDDAADVTEDEVEDTSEPASAPVGVGDFSEYASTEQTTGDVSETEFTLSGITDTAKEGYHLFVFEMTAKDGGTDGPYAGVKYVSSVGAVRVDLNMTTTDNSGIGYQQAREIDEQGIIRLYHNVSSDQTEEIYDIGVASSTTFYIYSEEKSDGVWNVSLEIKYPGESDVEVDTGSSDFSSEAQTITGGEVADGAKVTAYTYTASGGVLRVVYSVGGSTEKPIPSAIAEYDGSDNLVLKFTSIASDTVAKMPAALSMPGGITMVWEMDGSNASMYTFEGATGDFKLSAGTNPNQVIMEIKL